MISSLARRHGIDSLDASTGLWLCRECRPENFDPDHRLNTDGFKAGMDALANAFRDES